MFNNIYIVGDEGAAAAALPPPRRLNRNAYLGLQGAQSFSSSSFSAGGGRRRRRGRGVPQSMTVRLNNPSAPRNPTAQFEAEARELIANVKQRSRQQNTASGVDLSFDWTH